MAIQNDFTIYPASKVIRHTSGTTVYTAVAFYSWLMNTFDEPGYLTYQTPISFNTPTSFTMQNGWFLDNGDGSNILNYLYGGGIDTTGYSTISDPVYMLDLDNGGTNYATFATSDKDLVVTDDGVSVGPLLAYLDSYPTSNTARIWVRDTRGTPAAIADNSVVDVTGGSGSGDANGASVSGDDIYLNLFTISSFPGSPNPQLYIYQDHPQTGSRVRIAEWSNLANFDRDQSTGPASPNLIDVVFPIKLAGTLIDSGNFTTFARQTGDTFTFVESTISSAGRTPIATETSSDTVNVTEGEHYLMYSSASDPSYTAGTVIQDVATGGASPPTWYAEVVSYTALSTTSGYIVIRSLNGTPANTDAIYVGATQLGTATVSGSVGDTLILWSSGTDPSTLGQVMTGGTSGAKRLLRAVDATNNAAILQDDPTGVTGANRNAYYKDFTSGETVTGASEGSVVLSAASTTLISGYNDITVAHVNGTIVVNTFSGTFTPGEKVTWAGGGPAIMVYTDGSSTMTLGNVEDETALTTSALTITGAISGATCATNGTGGLTDANTQNFNFSLQSFSDPNGLYSVFIEGGSIYNDSSEGRSLTKIYEYLQYYLRDGQSISERIIYTSNGSVITQLAAEEYIKANSTYSATKAAPYGTLAGGVFFGAQAVWIQGMSSADNNNIKLTDSGGTLREPFTSITLTISNTRSGDRIAIYLENGSTTLPNKAQYTSHATNNILSGTIFDNYDTAVANADKFPNDTPTSGTFIAVDTSASEEHRYRYSSFNNTGGSGDDGQLVLTDLSSQDGTSTGGDSDTLANTGKDFTAGAVVKIGDIIRQTTDGGWGYVTAVAATSLEMTLNSLGNAWGPTKAYEINQLVVTYVAPGTNDDTFFIPYLDTRETTGTDGSPGTETVDLTYVSDREVVIEVRNVENATKIVPFKTTGTINSNGLTQSVIRTTDTVYA